MISNTRDMLNPQDLAEAKQVGLRRKLEDARTDINALPELPEGANNAVQQAGMEMKMEVVLPISTIRNHFPKWWMLAILDMMEKDT